MVKQQAPGLAATVTLSLARFVPSSGWLSLAATAVAVVRADADLLNT
jgi:hypothetical protein